MLVACYHQSVLPEASPAISTEQMSTDSTSSSKESPFVKRTFSPYLGEQWIGKAISYGCYRKGQAPGVKDPSEAEILEDLNILKEHWNLIRVYGADDAAERVLKVIHENQLPIRLMLGIWLENETKRPERKAENLEQINRGIALANQYPVEVIAINVGNESQVEWSWHHMEMDVLIQYIRMVRQNTKQPITTSDDYNFWNKPKSQTVSDEIDFIALHAYALWNGQLLDYAMTWTDSVFKDIKSRHPHQDIALTETGWATTYNPTKMGPGEQGSLIKGKVGVAEQQQFITEFWVWAEANKVTTFLFEAFDEPWKGGGEQSGPDEVEKHWGIFYEDRSPKQSFINYLAEGE
jgi:exo-beta-1,3-glucanase (GH17 family)